MKKTRTIEIRDNCVYYRSIKIGKPLNSLRRYFGLSRSGKVKITIKEKGPFTIKKSGSYYEITKNIGYVSLVCCKEFNRLFFKPNEREKYDIIVKRLKNEKT